MAHSPWARWLCVNELMMPSEAWNEGRRKKEGGCIQEVNRRRDAPGANKAGACYRCCYWINNFTCTRGSVNRAAFADQTVKAELSDDLWKSTQCTEEYVQNRHIDSKHSEVRRWWLTLTSTIKIHKTDGWQNKQYQHASQLASVCKNRAMTKS